MTAGRLIAVVGPSGVGKDSVMWGISAALPDMRQVQRVITRDPALGGEDFHAVSVDDFQMMVDAGAFCVHWGAHDLRYGIPVKVQEWIDGGMDCIVNFSRSALAEAAALFPDFLVLNITAQPATLAQRLSSRGRETDAQIAKRISVANKSLPDGLNVLTLSNDGPLEQTIEQAVSLLQPVRG